MRDRQSTAPKGMSHEPFFSVVIPTHNRADLILKTLHTVFAQTYSNYEVIVVDDCSTDNTAAVLEPLLKAEKIRYIKHSQNCERSRTRNTGMDHARGDFLTFLDSDDLMYPANLEDAAQYIKSNPESKFFHRDRRHPRRIVTGSTMSGFRGSILLSPPYAVRARAPAVPKRNG